MTTALADAPYRLSDLGLDYSHSTLGTPSDAVFSRVHGQPHDTGLSLQDNVLVVRVDGEVPAWLEPTGRALEELLLLEPNWDSYGALEIDVHNAIRVLELLAMVMQDDTPNPQLVPTNKGGIQIEWHCSGIDIEIETTLPRRFAVSYEDADRCEEREWEADLSSDWTHLCTVLARLA